MYNYRNCPYTGEKGWHIRGIDKLGGSGVLEWCFDSQDATEMLAEMKKFRRFSKLNAAPNDYQPAG